MPDRPTYRPVHKAIHRPLTVCGVDRRLFFLALILGAAGHALRDEAELFASTPTRDLEIAMFECGGHAVGFLTRNALSSRNDPPG